MFLKIGRDKWIQWDKVVTVHFIRDDDGTLTGGDIEWEGGGATINGREYAEAVWKKMFPTREYHDIL